MYETHGLTFYGGHHVAGQAGTRRNKLPTPSLHLVQTVVDLLLYNISWHDVYLMYAFYFHGLMLHNLLQICRKV